MTDHDWTLPDLPIRKKKPTKEKRFASEAALSKVIVDKFNSHGMVKCQKIRGSVYGLPTLDILGSKRGLFFWLEVKQEGEKPTDSQYNTMKEWIKKGAVASWTDSPEGAMKFLLAEWSRLTESELLEGFHGRNENE